MSSCDVFKTSALVSDQGPTVRAEVRPARFDVLAFQRFKLSSATGLLVVLAVCGLALTLSWRKWPDLLIDFGTQLYLPWQISSGAVLYRDVMYLTGGPISQYYHALLFSLCGPSLLAIVISNIVIGSALLALVYRLFLVNSDVWTATTIGLGITLTFACNQLSNIGNFNFITPYCHEVWHGLVLSIIAVALLSRWAQRSVPGPGHSNASPASAPGAESGMPMVTTAGLCAGLVFMTKPDVFVALMIAFLASLVLVAFARGTLSAIKGAVLAMAGAALPLVSFLFMFHRSETWGESFRSVSFAWVPLLNSSVSHQFFYKWCLGLDAPGFHVRMLLIHLVVLSATLGGLALMFRQKLDTSAKRLAAFGLLACLLALASGFDWVDCGRSLPVLCLVSCIALAAKVGRAVLCPPAVANDKLASSSSIFPFLWSLLSLALLAKLGFYCRIWHYGFALAMPAFVCALFLLLWLLPHWLEKFGIHRNLFRFAITLLLAVGFVRLFIQSQLTYRTKTVPVGHGRDTILAQARTIDPSAEDVRTALDWMDKHAAPNASLAVLPEGVMINYLSRRVNPTHYLVWNPAETDCFGQERMTEAFRLSPPDYVMLVHRDASEYGARFFGQQQSFGGELLKWIAANYQPVCLIGNEPLRNSLFGIKILKRTSSALDPAAN